MPSANSFGVISSASAFEITPSDSVDLAYITRAIYFGVGGDIKLLLVDDTVPVTFVNVPEGSMYPFQVKRVYETGRTVDDIVGIR
jgi:hypothetical protein